MQVFADPTTVRAIERARKAHVAAHGRWVSDDDDDPAREAELLASEAIAHLLEGRWDDAQACAEEVAILAEENGQREVWREFALLVEEAAETGRARQGVGDDD